MKLILLVLSMLISWSVEAHFKMGTYAGIDGQGQACKLSFLLKSFRYEIKNPLNEEVTVKLDSDEIYITSHLFKYDETSTAIGFEKDILTSYKGTKIGAESLRIYMSEAGPERYLLVSNQWTDGRKNVQECSGLIYQGQIN